MKHALAAALLALAASCASYDGYNLRAGVSTEAEVIATMGPPALDLRNADGSRQLAYPRGPLGVQTFMVDIAPGGTLQAIRQVLDDGVFSAIGPGLTRDQVLRMIGPPGDTMDFPRLQQESWEYRYRDTWGYIAFFSVNFDRNGAVVSKFTRRLERYDKGR